MSLLAMEKLASDNAVDLSAYDPTKWSLGNLIKKRTDLGTPFVGPLTVGHARPMEASTAIPGIYPHVIHWSDNIDWVFLVDNATAATTRRVILYEYRRDNSSFLWKGFITSATFVTAATVRGFRILYDLYTTGTVAVSGTAVTGSGTAWLTSKLAVGSRIGFGSTIPSQIGTWYEISAIGADGTITLTGSAGTIAAGTPYVIEDLRVMIAATCATATDGGLRIIKGLRYENFSSGGTVISAATTVDNIRAQYWVADAGTVTNTTAAGLTIKPKDSWSQQFAYVPDSTGIKFFKYNVRGALTLTAGKDTTTFVANGGLITGTQAVTGTMSVTNNGRYCTANHGPFAGIPGIYFVTTTRIYFTAESNITSGGTTLLNGTMVEIPPGSASSYAATGALAAIEYSDLIDRFIVMSTGAAGVRSYVTQFRTDSGQMDHIFLVDDKFLGQSLADANIPSHPSISALALAPWSEAGVLFLASVGTTAAANFLYAIPLGADWNYTSITNQRAITPKFVTGTINRFKRVYVVRDRVIGSDNLGKPADPMKIMYRTTGIDDNSGGWTAVTEPNDLSGISSSSQIQFAFEFKCISDFCIPSRIFLVGLVYDDISSDSHYQFSAAKSDAATKTFAWRQSVNWGSTVPALKVQLYNAITGGLLLEDTQTTTTGTWQKSTDGTNWVAYNTADRANETTYIRFIPGTLADNIPVRAILLTV